MEDLCLYIVHALGLGLVDDTVLLSLHHLTDRVDTTGSLSGVGIIGRHLQTALSHRFLPGNRVVGHRVVEHAVHVEKHGFGAESLKAVIFQIFLDRECVH